MRAVTPQFERESDGEVWFYPEDVEALEAIKAAPPEVLHSMGLRQFEEGFWLYPGEWYDHIPEGFEVTSITGKQKPFVSGKSDDDTRYGVLAFGFKKSS